MCLPPSVQPLLHAHTGPKPYVLVKAKNLSIDLIPYLFAKSIWQIALMTTETIRPQLNGARRDSKVGIIASALYMPGSWGDHQVHTDCWQLSSHSIPELDMLF